MWCAGSRKRQHTQKQAPAEAPVKQQQTSTAASEPSLEGLITAEPASEEPQAVPEACPEPLSGQQQAASVTPRLPCKAADPLAAMFADLQGQAALLGMQCSPAQPPQTPELTACQPATCSDSWLEDASTNSSASQQSVFSFVSEQGQQQPWYLPSATRVDAADLQQPPWGPCLLGEGGMGTVSLMHDTLADQLVAVKAPKPYNGSLDEHVMAAVEREHALNDMLCGEGRLVEYLGPVEQDGELTGALAFECMAGGSLACNMCASTTASTLPMPVINSCECMRLAAAVVHACCLNSAVCSLHCPCLLQIR